jgi:hypothetical protein
MISKYIGFLFAAFALAGCCVSGNGCYAPLPGTPRGWDGLDPAPTETASRATENRPRKNARPKKEIIIGPIGDVPVEPPKPEAKDAWAQQEAADQADEAKLKKRLMICRDCLQAPALNDTTGSVTR